MNLKEMHTSMPYTRRVTKILAAAALLAGLLMAMATMPSRAEAFITWDAETFWGPTVLQPGDRGGVLIELGNAGDETAQGWPTVDIGLPPGVTFDENDTGGGFGWACTAAGDPQIVTCSNPFAALFDFLWPKGHTFVGPGAPIRIAFTVDVAADAPTGVHQMTVTMSGSGAVDPVTETMDVRTGGPEAGFGTVDGSFTAEVVDETGADLVQAGAHPYEAVTRFKTTQKFNEPDTAAAGGWTEIVEPVANIKDVIVDLPAGFAGNPRAVPTCAKADVIDDACPAATQIGVAEALNRAGPEVQLVGLFNVVPDKDAPAQFMFNTGGGPVLLTPVVRSDGDWGLSVETREVTEGNPLFGAAVTVWGLPMDPSHDIQRCAIGSHVGDLCPGYNAGGDAHPAKSEPRSSGAPRRALLTNPTRCNGIPDVTAIHMSPWPTPGSFQPDGDPDLTDPLWATDTAQTPPLVGCDSLSFDPAIEVSPTETRPGGPSGLEFKLTLPQNEDPDGLATAHMRNATVTLPPGTTVNPGSADGLASCSSSEIGLVSKSPVRFTKLEPNCPLASKIGTVTVHTPLLADPLNGDVFLAGQGDHPFDSLAAIYMVVRGPGILGKLAGEVNITGTDPSTQVVKTTVIDNPQVPFETLTVRLKSGDRAPLTLPSTCGEHEVTADFTSWAGHDVEVADDFTVDCPDDAGKFDPTFAAGTSNPIGGASSPMRVRVTRDGGKELGRINMSLPRGLLAGPRDVAVCTDAQLQGGASKTGRQLQTAPSCPLESQIGTTTVGVGSGTTPFFPLIPGTAATGRIFLTGTHHTSDSPAPPGMGKIAYGAAIEVPAVAGPFDLGRVLVRAAIYADPTTADLKVISDKLPRVQTTRSGPAPDAVDDVVLDARDVRVDIDRADFVRNPTSCREQQFGGEIQAQDGTTVQRSSRFQLGDCAALPFKPRLALRLTGRRQVRTGKHPGVRARVTQRAGEAGIKQAAVLLPKSLALDPDNAQALCEYADGIKPDLESRCPKGSIIGRARAASPLLKNPLVGNVYFVKNVRTDPNTGNLIRTLPMIIVALRGEVAVNLVGESSTKAGKLVNTFDDVPDAPISQFNLNIRGGSNGILAVTRTRRADINLCAKPSGQVAEVDMEGQNGRRHDFNVRMKTPCRKPRQSAAAICRKRTNAKPALRRCIAKVKSNRAKAAERRAAAERKRAAAKRGASGG